MQPPLISTWKIALPIRMIHTVLICLLACAPAYESRAEVNIVFPDDAGVIDVTRPPYNAKGDGVTDDTAAINAALRDHNVATSVHPMMSWTIYLPAGTYLVTDSLQPLSEKSGNHPLNCVRIVGQGRDKTIVKLKDNAPGFNDPRHAKYVLRTGYYAAGVANNRASGGNQPNSAYNNYIQHLTVDVGQGNPGAGGVRFDVANVGAMQDVRIVSSDSAHCGAYGLGLFGTGGLGYVKRVTIEGFDHGLHVENTVNNYVFEHIRLENQQKAGIYNEGKVISIRDLVSRNVVPALTTRRVQAATFLIEADLQGLDGGPAVVMTRPSFLYVRDLQLEGYSTPIQVADGSETFALSTGQVDEWWSHSASVNEGARSLRLPIRETPEYENPDLSQWANVVDFGATPNDDSDDDAPGIQAAIDSGKPIVYFPRAMYTLKSDVVVRGDVKKLDFFFSRLMGDRSSGAVLRVAQDAGHQVILENCVRSLPLIHDSAGAVVIKNHVGSYSGPLTTGERASGDLYVENTGPHASIQVGPGVHAWLRAVNREKSPLLNDGGTVWFYGDNIESMRRKGAKKNPARISPIRTLNNGKTEYLAGCIDALTIHHRMQDGPLFETIDATLSANAAGEARRGSGEEGHWPWYFRSTQHGEEERVVAEDVVHLREGSSWPRRTVVPMFVTQPSQTTNSGQSVTEGKAGP